MFFNMAFFFAPS